jgi:uncharacterized membrane protein
MDFRDAIELLGLVIDVAAVGVIFVSAIAAGVVFVRGRIGRSLPVEEGYRQLRQGIGRGVLLGLELLVAGDIIRTVAIEPTIESVGVLAAIVVVRTFLSFALEVELTGRWPWDRERERGATGAR